MKKHELLVPVGDMECLRQAIMNGCDAVYGGCKDFGARKFAKNFTNEDFKKLGLSFSKIAHTHHMTVQTCGEYNTLEEYGFRVGDCVPRCLVKKITGKNYPKWKGRRIHQEPSYGFGLTNR